jgi:PleD family two-component response regulator
MPESDGFDVCCRLREMPEFAAKPILVLLEDNSAASVGRAFKAGANDYVTKPIDWMLLCYKLNYRQRANIAA